MLLQSYFSRDVEKHLFCPMFGFKDGFSMKDNASPHHKVSEITIPLLCLNAEDDPVCLGEYTNHLLLWCCIDYQKATGRLFSNFVMMGISRSFTLV